MASDVVSLLADPALAQRVAEEVPVIVTLLGDETKKVAETIDDLLEKGVSQQVQEQANDFQGQINALGKKVIAPPYDPLKLALMLEQNTRLNRSCQLRARNTMGLGWEVVQIAFDIDEKAPPASVVKAQKARLKKVYGNPNPMEPSLEKKATPLDFTEISYRYKFDEEATGNGYVEITRNNAGQIDGIYHIPGHTVRVMSNGGFIQIRGTKRKFFKRFGDARVIDAETGEVSANLSQEKRATELLQFMVYSPRSSWYGIPRWISAVAAIQGSRLSSIRNVAFFENDAVGRLAIVVSGGALTTESVNDIRNFVNREGKGVEKSHRVMVLQAEPRRVVSGKSTPTKIEVVPLTVGINEDASFLKYRKANDEEVRESMGLSTPFFTSEGVNRASAGILRQLTIEQDLVPDIKAHEHVWNNLVSFDILTGPLSDAERGRFLMAAEMRYESPKNIDDLELAQIQGMLSRAGLATINEGRQSIGLSPLPDEFVFGQLPLPLAIAFLETGLLYQGPVTENGAKSFDAAEAASAAAAAEGGNGDGEKGVGRRLSEKTRDELENLTGLALGLKKLLKRSMGRDVLEAELVLQRNDGEVLDRISLDSLKDETEE